MQFIPRCAPLVIEPPCQADRCIIILHGLTTSGIHFRPVADYLAEHFPTTKFILPSAPVRFVQWANGNVAGWYDLLGNNFLAKEDEQGIQSAVQYVHSLIREQMAQGFDSTQIFIGGFSQGCTISLLAGTTFDSKLGGIFGFSGYLPLSDIWQQQNREANRQTPIFLAHGTADELITPTQIEPAKQLLSRQYSLTFKSYPIGHYLVQDELHDLAKWLNQIVE